MCICSTHSLVSCLLHSSLPVRDAASPGQQFPIHQRIKLPSSAYPLDQCVLGSSPYGPDAPRPLWLFGPHNLISAQSSPVPLPKFQMVPRFKILNVLWVQEMTPDILSLSPLGRPRCRWEDNIKMELREMAGGCGDWMELAQDRGRWRALVSTVMNLRVP